MMLLDILLSVSKSKVLLGIVLIGFSLADVSNVSDSDGL